uniref:Uncharacterized protein n=1 Tax=Mycena chlorophos TaxID=658473 RepID=A0ABQ0LIH0_MYCCL|nr:predicted protein [Mycena chlorophos]
MNALQESPATASTHSTLSGFCARRWMRIQELGPAQDCGVHLLSTGFLLRQRLSYTRLQHTAGCASPSSWLSRGSLAKQDQTAFGLTPDELALPVDVATSYPVGASPSARRTERMPEEGIGPVVAKGTDLVERFRREWWQGLSWRGRCWKRIYVRLRRPFSELGFPRVHIQQIIHRPSPPTTPSSTILPHTLTLRRSSRCIQPRCDTYPLAFLVVTCTPSNADVDPATSSRLLVPYRPHPGRALHVNQSPRTAFGFRGHPDEVRTANERLTKDIVVRSGARSMSCDWRVGGCKVPSAMSGRRRVPPLTAFSAAWDFPGSEDMFYRAIVVVWLDVVAGKGGFETRSTRCDGTVMYAFFHVRHCRLSLAAVPRTVHAWLDFAMSKQYGAVPGEDDSGKDGVGLEPRNLKEDGRRYRCFGHRAFKSRLASISRPPTLVAREYLSHFSQVLRISSARFNPSSTYPHIPSHPSSRLIAAVLSSGPGCGRTDAFLPPRWRFPIGKVT